MRLEEDFDADPVLFPNASWRDPNAVETWAREISPDEEVVVYCVRRHWVSQSSERFDAKMGAANRLVVVVRELCGN